MGVDGAVTFFSSALFRSVATGILLALPIDPEREILGVVAYFFGEPFE
jgi:hypothetical protein